LSKNNNFLTSLFYLFFTHEAAVVYRLHE